MSPEVLLSILHEKLHDQRFLRLIENLLKAGYLEQWRHHATLSSCPQGGMVSLVLSNIYLDRLDQYVEQMLLPPYTRGTKRQRNKQYNTLQVHARFGGIQLRRQVHAILMDSFPFIARRPARNELLKRLLAEQCELCQSTEQIEVHHIRKLADLKRMGQKDPPLWVQVMEARRRKTLVLCRTCHDAVHVGKPTKPRNRTSSLES